MSWGMDDDELDEEDFESEESIEEEVVDDDSEDSDSWGSDVQDIDESDDDDEQENEVAREDLPFPARFVAAVEDGDVEDITVSTLEEHYKEIDDIEALQKAGEQDTRSSASDVYDRRLNQIGVDEDDEVDEDEGWGVDDSDDEIEEVDEIEDVGIDNLADEDEGDTTDADEKQETTDISSLDEEAGEIEEIDIDSVAPGAMDTDEASEKPYLWRILGWAEPGKGKTHFGFTMPQPVCIIDTEGKAHNLASKFEDKITYIWQPEDYDEAREALDEAISVLYKYLEKGHRGTIVVDSMSEMWEWSKQKYVSKTMNGKTLEEVNLSSNMGRSGESDWKVIKRFHNKRFREVMIDTPFHYYWTAMQTDDYEAIMEGEEGNPKKPVGERDNGYKVDQVLRFVEGPNGKPRGQLQKSGSVSKYAYVGLEYPTFPKHKQACEEIRELEVEGKDPMIEGVMNGDVRVVEGNPGRWSDD